MCVFVKASIKILREQVAILQVVYLCVIKQKAELYRMNVTYVLTFVQKYKVI